MEVLCADACVGDAAVSFLRVDPITAAPTTAQDAGAQAPLGASVAGLAADAAAQPAPRHAHSHLLHIIQHQQERIARLTAALAHSAASHQHVTDALGRVQQQQHPRQPPHRCGGACGAAPSTHAAVRLSVESVTAAASAAVRWADVAATVTDAAAAAADAGGPLSTEADGEAAAHHEAPVDAVPWGAAPGVSAAAPSITPQPVILLDITSMFTTRLHHDVAAAPLKSVRRSMDTQTDCDPADSPHAAAAAAAVEQLQRDLDVTKRRLREAEAAAQAARCVTAATAASAVLTCPAALPGSPATASLADALADLSDAGVPLDGSKDLAELRRLRLLLRFSELKKDSDRLAGAEEALQESAAAQLRLRQRCDRLEHEKAQRGDCLRAIASFIHTTLAAARADPPHLHRGGIGPFRTAAAAAAAATPTIAPLLSADVVAVLEYVLRLCTDAVPPTSTEPPHFTPMPPPPVPLPCASDDGEAWRQDRLHKAVVDGRSGAGGHRPPPCRPPSRRASWRAGGSSSSFAAAEGLGERRASKF